MAMPAGEEVVAQELPLFRAYQSAVHGEDAEEVGPEYLSCYQSLCNTSFSSFAIYKRIAKHCPMSVGLLCHQNPPACSLT